MRSSSLKLSRDAFDTESDLSNMDELAMVTFFLTQHEAFDN
jgi:hypothetical protein